MPVDGSNLGTTEPVGVDVTVICTVGLAPVTVADCAPPFTVPPANTFPVVVVVPLWVIVVFGTLGCNCGTVTVNVPLAQLEPEHTW